MRNASRWICHWTALAGMALCLLGQPARAAAPGQSQLAQAESLRTRDHPRFLLMLQQLQQHARELTPGEQWHLRYLMAWQAAYEGDYPRADAQLREIIAHAGEPALVAKSTARLMDDLNINRRYEESFTLANQLMIRLPHIKDPLARFLVLFNLSQVFGSAGQYELAENYARQLESSLPAGESRCASQVMLVTARFNGGKLTSTSPELPQAADHCMAAGQPVYAETMWLELANLYLDEAQPRKAVMLIQPILPGIKANQYHPHIESAGVMLGQAYWQLGDAAKARDLATTAVATAGPDEVNETLRDGYQVLYRVAKQRGDMAAALTYYESYATQDKAYLNDVSARSLAYQMVQQRVLAEKLKTAELGRQNSALRLQQALTARAVETGRLYIALLLLALAFIVWWLFRLKRSQLRFKRMARRDGLTDILNHQHFISDADQLLSLMQKKPAQACLVSIDLDHFKQVNDTHGHAMGDAVLKHIVAICQQHLRPGDLFGRLGGEEFGILLGDCSHEQGVSIAERIRKTIAATPLQRDASVVAISASIGLASTAAAGYRLVRLCMEADAALYRAKRAGRNRLIADSGVDRTIEA
ncbi:tetratricopeptide repeat-containing diguanylate cyclase [Rhodanobacter ginsengiterrae]|uniref:tetratricopeptide repeat-containing diguanylate cyclase n=1 Tax=Rhodanobacter ginsengiterrae TaxID=2008451 RepID=UPI003CEA697C